MFSTIISTLTNEFGTLADIAWYESAYVWAFSVTRFPGPSCASYTIYHLGPSCGSALTSVASGLYATLNAGDSTSQWLGCQILTTVGRGIAFQVPFTIVQEFVPAADNAPGLLQYYAPEIDVNMVFAAEAKFGLISANAWALPGI
ncbi:hypothetical protein TruAng_011298 [Truncatella angustata]|nr:hypothetical protein TruAng_011298 [Truncatella angustata]